MIKNFVVLDEQNNQSSQDLKQYINILKENDNQNY